MSALKYSYHEERGEFHGYVEDEMGNVIFEMHYPEFYEDDETGELLESSTIFEDGFMKHADDTEGLRKYLVDMRLINEDDEVIHEDDYKSKYEQGGLTSGDYGHGTSLLEKGGEMDIEEEDKEENEIDEHLQRVSDDSGIPVDVLRSYADEVGMDYMDLRDDLPYNGSFGTQEDFAEHLVDEGIITDLSNYLYMTDTDIRILAGEEADARLDGMDDEDIAEAAGKEDEYEELKDDLERLEELNDEIEVLESDIKEKKDAFDHENATEEERDDFDADIKSDEEQLEESKEQLELLSNKLEYSSIEDFIDDIRDDALSNINDEITEQLEKDAVGYFEDLGYSQKDLANHSLFSIDYEKLAEDISYDYVFIEGEDGDYYIFNNYADGGNIPVGYHQMPDGTIMPDSAHLEHGGGVAEGNLHMVKNQAEQFEHHAKELQEALKKNPRVDAWVVAKAERAATDLSDITHYLEGLNNEHHGDGEDTIKMDVPLFIRSQEYAREDAKSDADLHEFADNAIELSQSGETLEMDDYNKLVPNHMADGGETPITWKVAYFETIPTRGGEMMTRLATHENIKGDLQQVIDVVKEKIGRYDYANITDTKGVVSGAKIKKDKSVVKFNRGGVNLGASFDKLKKQILDPNIYSPRDLKVGETYEWLLGAEPLKVKYIGLADENKDKKAGSSMGKGFLFEWVEDAGRYVELNAMALNRAIKKITGFANGGEVNPKVYEKVIVTIRDVDMGGDVIYKNDHWFIKKTLDVKSSSDIGKYILNKYLLDNGNTYKFSVKRTGETMEMMADGGEMAKGGMVEYVLYGTKVGKKDWQEEILATKPFKFSITPELLALAKKDGYDRLRIAKIDLSTPPDFKKTIKRANGGEMAKGGVIATSPTKEGIKKLISEYYYGSTITLNQVGDDYEVSNAKGKIKGVKVISNGGKYKFVEDNKKSVGGFIAGLAVGAIGTKLLEKKDKLTQSNSQPTTKDLTWREELKMYDDKEGFDYAINEFSGDIEDSKFNQLKKDYITKTKALKKYIESKNLVDNKYDISVSNAIDKEGFDYALVGYNDWKGIKDKRFQSLYSNYKTSRKNLSKYIGIKSTFADGGEMANGGELYSLEDVLIAFGFQYKSTVGGMKVFYFYAPQQEFNSRLKRYQQYMGVKFKAILNEFGTQYHDKHKVTIEDEKGKEVIETDFELNERETIDALIKALQKLGLKIKTYAKGGKTKLEGWDKNNSIFAYGYAKDREVKHDGTFEEFKKSYFKEVPQEGHYNDIVLRNAYEQLNKTKGYAKGGATFDDKVKAIAPDLVGKEVPKRLRKDYGKKYNKKEALEAARRIAGSMRAKEMKKGKK